MTGAARLHALALRRGGVVLACVEDQTGASVAADGTPAPTVLTLGLRLGYSLREALGD